MDSEPFPTVPIEPGGVSGDVNSPKNVAPALRLAPGCVEHQRVPVYPLERAPGLPGAMLPQFRHEPGKQGTVAADAAVFVARIDPSGPS